VAAAFAARCLLFFFVFFGGLGVLGGLGAFADWPSLGLLLALRAPPAFLLLRDGFAISAPDDAPAAGAGSPPPGRGASCGGCCCTWARRASTSVRRSCSSCRSAAAPTPAPGAWGWEGQDAYPPVAGREQACVPATTPPHAPGATMWPPHSPFSPLLPCFSAAPPPPLSLPPLLLLLLSSSLLPPGSDTAVSFGESSSLHGTISVEIDTADIHTDRQIDR
jgi:hypothetical protein